MTIKKNVPGQTNHWELICCTSTSRIQPQAPGVTLDNLKKYYQAGYKAARKYTPDAYEILSSRLGPSDPTELLQFASNLDKLVIDVHYYNLYGDKFKSMTVQKNIDFVNNDRSKDLSTIMVANGPLIFVVNS
ncbi:uncharacterized protein LOC144559405 [Carex rostrata]